MQLSFVTVILITLLINGITSYVILESIKTDKPIINETMYANIPNLRELDMSNQTSFEFPKDQVLLAHEQLSLYMCNNCGVKSIYKQSFSKLSQLTLIELKNNSLEYVHPDAFEHNPRLDKIDLSGNQLVSFNPETTIRHISALSILDLSQNFKLDLNKVKLESTRLMIFSCNNCDTTYLDRNTLAGMPRLSQINLKDNSIERINDNAMDSLPYLKSLNLDGNRGLQSLNFKSKLLKRLSAQNCSLEGTLHTSNFPALCSLNVRGNRITHLDELALLENQKINFLLLDDNEIEKIPDKLLKMPQLQTLCLDQNLLQPYEHTQQAASVYKSRHLRKDCLRDDDFSHQFEYHLPSGNGIAVYRKNPVHHEGDNGSTINLSGKNIVFIEQDYLIDYLNVKELLFDNNHQFDFQDSMNFLESESIEVLSMQNCSITTLYNTTFEKMPMLRVLNLQGNEIQTLHSSSIFMKNPEISYINLAQNKLKLLSVILFQNLHKLDVLILDHNKGLSSTGDNFLLSTSIRNLSCAHCGFAQLGNQTLALLPNLQHLNLEYNHIESVDANSLGQTSKLEYVNLRKNPLKVFEPLIDRLGCLTTLCIEDELLNADVLKNLEGQMKRLDQLEELCEEQKLSERLRKNYNRRTTTSAPQLKLEMQMASMRMSPSSGSGTSKTLVSIPVLLVSVLVVYHRYVQWAI